MYPYPPQHERAPILMVDQNFDHELRDGTGVTVGSVPRNLFSTSDRSWMIVNSASEAGDCDRIAVPYRLGVISVDTSALANNYTSVFMDLGNGDDSGSASAPSALVLGTNWYRWEWWVELPSVSNVSYFLGLLDSFTLASNNLAILFYDSSSSANLHILARNGSATAAVDTGVAATTGWHKFAMERVVTASGPTVNLYQDHVLIGSTASNLPTAPLSPAAIVRARGAAVVKTLNIDRCIVWTDGWNALGGGSP